jgi:hypothetical protein
MLQLLSWQRQLELPSHPTEIKRVHGAAKGACPTLLFIFSEEFGPCAGPRGGGCALLAKQRPQQGSQLQIIYMVKSLRTAVAADFEHMRTRATLAPAGSQGGGTPGTHLDVM